MSQHICATAYSVSASVRTVGAGLVAALGIHKGAPTSQSILAMPLPKLGGTICARIHNILT